MEIGFGEKLKQARTAKRLKQSELAKQLGVTNTTISNWENNVSKPDLDMLSYICGVLEVKVSYFLEAKPPEHYVSALEYEHIEKYRDLDPLGQAHVNTLMNWELERVKSTLAAEKELSTLREQLESKPSLISTERRPRKLYYITYYQKLASAGRGEYLFNDIPTDLIAVADTPIARKADFVIGVTGDSMEPTYHDGDRVFVLKTDEISIGEIGIFVKGNDCFIKELREDRLKSHNPAYPDIPASEAIRCVGLVLGKIELS